MRTLNGLALLSLLSLAAATPFAQGRCIRTYGSPACNTDPIPRPFESTGWRTAALEHLTFRVADPEKEAAFYAALMGWTVRSTDRSQVVMDIGSWGTVVFKAAPLESFTGPVHAVVESFGVAIEPWDAAAVLPILEEAGGRFVDWTGAPDIHGGSGIGAPAALMDEVLAILRDDPA